MTALHRTVGYWVACSERLPAENEYVLVWIQELPVYADRVELYTEEQIREMRPIREWAECEVYYRAQESRELQEFPDRHVGWVVDSYKELRKDCRITHWAKIIGPEDIRGFIEPVDVVKT